MLDFQNKGAGFKRTLMSDVQDLVGRMISTISATIATQKDGASISDQHRVLNFQGAGVTVSDDPTMRRTNVLIGGTALVSTPTQLVISTTAAKKLSLWNGSSNNAPPANWQTVAFNDSGWAAAVVATGGAATTITGASKLWAATTPAGLTEQVLVRHSFTVAAGTYQDIAFKVEADNFVDAVYLNGTLLGSALNGVPAVSESRATFSITPSVLIVGTNVLAIQGRNADSVLSAAWAAYVINSTLVTAAPTTSNTASSVLGSNVTMTNANQYYDGPSVSLGIGTWLVMAAVDVAPAVNGTEVGAKIWDGTTVYASAETWAGITGSASTTFLATLITLGSTTTIKVSAVSQIANSTLRSSLIVNAAGNTCTYIRAIQIA